MLPSDLSAARRPHIQQTDLAEPANAGTRSSIPNLAFNYEMYSWLEPPFLMSVNDCFILKAALTHDGVVQLGLEAGERWDSIPALWHTGRCVRDQAAGLQSGPTEPAAQPTLHRRKQPTGQFGEYIGKVPTHSTSASITQPRVEIPSHIYGRQPSYKLFTNQPAQKSIQDSISF